MKSADGKTLTFYYDTQRASRTETTYDLNYGDNVPAWNDDRAGFTKVVFDKSFENARPITCYHWFFYFINLTTITDIKYLNTSKVTNMEGMFDKCKDLTQLDLSSFNTANVTNMRGMFSGCSSLTYSELNISSFNTANVTDMSSMFSGCSSLTELNLSNFNTANITDMSHMFYACSNLTEPNLSSFNTANVTYMIGMFNGCSSLTGLNLSNFNTANVTEMRQMFLACSNLTVLDLSNFNTSQVKRMNSMFNGCTNLKTIFISDKWNTDKVTYSVDMFNNCPSLKGEHGTTYNSSYIGQTYAHRDGGAANPGYLTLANKEAYAALSYDGKTLTFYYDTHRASHGTTYDLNTDKSQPGWYTDDSYKNYTDVVFDISFTDAQPTTCYLWFYGFNKLTTITDLQYLNTSKVTDMSYMFSYCTSLTGLDLSTFDTKNVTSFDRMFYSCSSLNTLNLCGINTKKVTNMYSMFYGCSSLSELDLCTFNTANVEKIGYMFGACSNLETIYVSDRWKTGNVSASDDMFADCTDKLKGGKGTTWNDSNLKDKTYAHADGGITNPGYMTLKEPYAVKTGSTLTFYFDDQRDSRAEPTYSLNANNEEPTWYDDRAEFTKVVFDESFKNARPTTCYWWFYGFTNLTTITGIQYLNTSEVEDMTYMFSYCTSLSTLDLSTFDTENVTSFDRMFFSCSSLSALDLSKFNTAKVTNMYSMFCECANLTKLDLSSFNTANVEDMRYLFYKCSNLKTIYVSDKWETDKVTISKDMFYGCTAPLAGGQGTDFNDSNPTDKTYAHLDGGTSNPGYLTLANKEAYAALSYDETTLTFYYDTHRASHGTTFDLNNGYDDPGWFYSNSPNIEKVVFDESFKDARPTSCGKWFLDFTNLTTITDIKYLNTSKVTNMKSMFGRCRTLTELTLSSFNTANVTDMSGMFSGCSSLTGLNLNNFNTANVTDMGWMFYDCSNLTELNLSNLNTANVTDMSCMFSGCSSLTYSELNISKFNTANVTNMSEMFSGCSGLTELNLSNFNTANVTYMIGMFSGCSSLTGLNLSNFNTANVTEMSRMFYACSNLTKLDLSSFNTSQVTHMISMFNGCSNLKTIYVSDKWNADNIYASGDMFNNCTNLKGEYGTTYNSSYTDKTYAHRDGGAPNPGYLSYAEMYAVKSSDGTTLTFYYDKLRATRTEITYGLNTGENNPEWFSDKESFTTVVFDESFKDARPFTCYGWFGGFKNLKNIDHLEYLNTSEVTNMCAMFGLCGNLKSINLSSFNTAKVKDMQQMFISCTSLASLDLSAFDTGNVTNMTQMFMSCSTLTTIYVSDKWNANNVNFSTYMFNGCSKLKGGKETEYNSSKTDKTYAHIDGGTPNPGYLTEAGAASYAAKSSDGKTLTFYHDTHRASHGTTYDLNYGNSFPAWYNDREEFTTVVFDESFQVERPKTCYCWFFGMTNLSTIENIEYMNTSDVEYMSEMFYDCSSLTELDLSSFNTAKVTTMDYMFAGCSGLTELDLSSFNTAKVMIMNSMFQGCSGLTELVLSSFNTAKVGYMFYMFDGCSGLTELDLSSFNTANVESMSHMFNGCSKLETIYVSGKWNTDKVTNSEDMFYGCTAPLKGGKGTTYNDSNPKDKEYARVDGGTSNPGYLTLREAYAVKSTEGADVILTFYCDDQRSTRTEITYDLNTGKNNPVWYNDRSGITKVVFDESFKQARPTTCCRWFLEFSDLTSIEHLDYLNTQNVTNMSYMFLGCEKLSKLDLNSFNTANVEDMSDMFKGCEKLKKLDLSSFGTQNVTDMSAMFLSCIVLETIEVSEKWNTSRVFNYLNMFGSCSNLVGGKGTTFNSIYDGITYAHIDGGTSNPGYLTLAVEKPYAVKSADGKTFTFYYDTHRVSRIGTVYEVGYDPTNLINWRGQCGEVTTVKFDESFDAYRPDNCDSWFDGFAKLETIEGLDYLHTDNVTSMSNMFQGCSSLETIEFPQTFKTDNVENMMWMFGDCSNLKTLDIKCFNTSKVKDFSHMFSGCKTIEEIDLSSFATPAALDLWGTFENCESLKTLKVDKSMFDTKNVTDMRNLFKGCKALSNTSATPFDPSFLNTQNVTKMSGMFDGCSGLTSLDLSNFSTDNVLEMGGMFFSCSNLKNIDLSSFNTANVTSIKNMFYGCSSLEWVDISSFDTQNVTDMQSMFENCSNLNTVLAPANNWVVTSSTNTGFSFNGCTNIIGGEGTKYDPNQVKLINIDGGVTSPGYLTAGNAFKVFYELDGGTNDAGNPPSFAKDITEDITIKAPTKEGYTFSGWTGTAASGLSATTPTTDVKITPDHLGNRIYTAHWTVNQYTITFDTKGGSAFRAPITQYYGTQIPDLSGLSEPTKLGYDFDGWDKAIPTTMPAEDVTVSAKWNVHTYNITYDLDGGQMPAGKSNPATYTIESETFTLANPEKEGHTFEGWNNGKTTEPTVTIAKGSTEDMAFTAQWTRNTYTITFETGCDIAVAAMNVEYDADVTVPQTLDRDGYTFLGWTPDVPAKMPAHDISLTAKWKEFDKYTITFNTDGGTPVEPITKKQGEAVSKPADPTKVGHTFKGWDTEIPATMPDEDLTITAQWEVRKYTITFTDEDGNNLGSYTDEYGKPVPAPADPKREGYDFVGWDKEFPMPMPAEDVTVKATWKIHTHTITFDTKGGTAIAAITQDYGTAIAAPQNPEKEGHTFTAWDKTIPATMPDEDLTITAQWKVNQYTLTFKDSDGNVIAAITDDFGAPITAPADPVR
ncbi:MAG: BspA family leucine-rich repeat surface protein, partial [Bacteroidales bacterium]|nr:BspA family leucine-rich repeat surface protein [Bacteroidales bacterium]